MRATKLKSTTALKAHSQPSAKQWTPDAEQLLGVKWLLEHAAAGLFLDPGAGKTSITYAAIKVLKKKKLFKGAIVVAPLRPATTTWPSEQREWLDFADIDVAVLHGKHKNTLVQERHDVYVVNYEGLAWLIAAGHLKRLLACKWVCTLVFDELTRMKNAKKKNSKRAMEAGAVSGRKALVHWLPKFDRRWGLTGSPAANGLLHLFGMVYVLDLGKAFGQYISHYRAMFFNPVGMWGWVLKEGAADLIYARLNPLALRMELGSGVKLPAARYNDIIVDLPDAARKVYDDMEDQMLAILDDDTIAAGSASAVYGKCWQIASGAVFKSQIDPITGEPLAARSSSREWHHIHDAKLDALEELLEEIQGQQVLVAYWFEHDLERLKARFGKDTPHIGKGVSVKKAKEYEDAWNAGTLRLMFGHPMSMAHGLNYQKSNARHIVFYSVMPDFELYDQFIRRIRRRGNKSKFVYIHHILARRTVDTWGIMPSLRRKDAGQLKLFDALRRLSRNRK